MRREWELDSKSKDEDKARRAKKQLARLVQQKEALEVESSASELDPAAAREKLLAKVKEDKAKMEDLDRRVKAQTEENERLREEHASRGVLGDGARAWHPALDCGCAAIVPCRPTP